MRTASALSVLVAITSLSCAAAQTESVIVNPDGARVLYDPGSGQERVVPPLLHPWEKDQPIRLRPPSKYRKATRSTPAPAAPDTGTSLAVTPEPPRKPRRTATTAPRPSAPPPAPPPQQSAPISGFADFQDLISPQPSAPPPPPRKAATAAPPPRKAAPEPPPRAPEPARVERPAQKASIEPPRPAKSRAVTGTPRESIPFAPNASDPTTSAVATVRNLADSLTAALGDGHARVQLMAYAGQRGEKTSDTRRMSLKRALVIRQLLIDDGVPSERIDVFALGGADDNGPLDRVDVFVKG